jgi:uncharacterized membrane protein
MSYTGYVQKRSEKKCTKHTLSLCVNTAYSEQIYLFYQCEHVQAFNKKNVLPPFVSDLFCVGGGWRSKNVRIFNIHKNPNQNFFSPRHPICERLVVTIEFLIREPCVEKSNCVHIKSTLIETWAIFSTCLLLKVLRSEMDPPKLGLKSAYPPSFESSPLAGF